ncbi:MAG: PAS domain-containing protein [Clostridia bacterium]|nr:PAS domain-containing protein [Clostridia bacterium]
MLYGVFAVISIIVGLVLLNVIIKPILKLIKNAELVANGEQSEIRYLDDGKTKNEIDELTKAFSLMHGELNENLNEVSRQKKQIETILLNITDGIIAFNMDGKIIHCNRAAEQMLEIKDKNLTFKEIFDNLDVDINLEKVIYLENWTSTESRVSFGEKTLNLFFAPFKDENDRPGGVIIVIQDITEHVKLDMMRTEFVADVSHELKTPITSILGYADTLLEGECDEEISKKFLERISDQAKRMSVLVTDLLTLSRYDSDMVVTQKTEFDLGELVKNTYDNLIFEIEKKKQKAECFVTADVPYVYADRAGIERVVTNILTNAIKYTPEGGEIKIYVGFVYNDAYIKIIDTGIGIPEEDLEKIFERFYRVDKARTREMGGTGLGLAIAKEIIERNDSRIDIKSELGKGTEVVIRIPTKHIEDKKEENK